MAGDIQRRVRIVYEVDGVDAAAEDQQALAQALEGTGRALADQSEAVGELEQAMGDLSSLASRAEQVQQRLHQSLQALAGGLQQVSSALGTENEGGRVLGQMSHFAATGIQLGSAFGPLGGVLGGVTGAVLGLGEALTPVPPAIREVTDEATRGAQAITDLGDSFVGAGDRMRQFLDSVSTAGRMRGLQDLNAQITEISDRIANISTSGSATDRLQLPELRERLASMLFESQQQTQGLTDEGGFSGGRRGGRAGQRQTSWQKLEELMRRAGGGRDDALGFAGGLGGDQFRPDESDVFTADAERQRRNRRFGGQTSEEGRAHQAQLAHLREIAEKQKQNHDEQMRRITEQVNAWTQAGERIGGVISGAFTAAIQGQEDFGTALLKGFKMEAVEFGGKMINEGIAALLTAAGESVLNPPAAASKAIEGAGKVALGVGLGAAGAAIPVPSATPSAQAKPPRLGPAANGAGGGGNTIVNLNAPALVTSTEAQLGRTIGRTLTASARRFGEAA